jgi:hypothetical protein
MLSSASRRRKAYIKYYNNKFSVLFRIANEAKVVALKCKLDVMPESNIMSFMVEKMCSISIASRKSIDKLEAELSKEKAERLSAFKMFEEEITRNKAKKHDILNKCALIINAKKKKLKELRQNPQPFQESAPKQDIHPPLGSLNDSSLEASQKISTLAELFK